MLTKAQKLLQKHFSIYSNQRHQIKEVIEGKEIFYDHNINQYEPCIQAFVQKRRTKKNEIPPKIHIIDPLETISQSLQQQKLQPLKTLYDLEQQQRIHQHKAYNTQYITSIVCEPYFKNLMDEYLDKVMISGGTVPLEEYESQQAIKNKVIKLYRTFFFGDELTELEKEIEFRYLVMKQQKFFKYQEKDKNRYRCIWTYSQQRRVELMKNWRYRDHNLYDDFRPIYEDLKITEKDGHYKQMLQINQDGIKRRILYNWFESRYFNPKTRKFFEFITQYLQTRTYLYTNSIEFNTVLNIPPDFHIEHSILNMHLWMIIDRLKKINSRESRILWKNIEYLFKQYTLESVGKIHLRKKTDFIKDVNHFMINNRRCFDRHFNQMYVEDPYEKIDALVWSSIFFEKVERYSEEVYLMSEYFIQNYRYIQSLDLEEFYDCNLQWDVYRISLDYKEKILARNPQLSQDEFQEELESDKKDKKYYYSYQLPIQEEMNKQEKSNDIANRARYSMFSTIRKFQNMETYDYFNEVEEKNKKQKQEAKTSPWMDRQSIVDHDEDYHLLLKLKRKREQQQKQEQQKQQQSQE